MKVVSFVSQKGGSGKSTLAISCAVAADLDQKKALIIDTDPQGTSENWFQRTEIDQPVLLKIESHQLKQALFSAQEKAFDLVIIDTPGRDEPCIASVIENSDFCLIPCRPTPADMKASPPTIAIIQRLHKHQD